jgi:hypothetical protein
MQEPRRDAWLPAKTWRPQLCQEEKAGKTRKPRFCQEKEEAGTWLASWLLVESGGSSECVQRMAVSRCFSVLRGERSEGPTMRSVGEWMCLYSPRGRNNKHGIA